LAPREADGDEDALVGRRFVHVFEEDGPEGEVYRPDGPAIPKSRRPRESIELHADGTATVASAGPADRPERTAARWRREDGAIVLRVPAAAGRRAAVLRVVEASPERLVVRR
jgi:hypothetical protein